jgi:hypothetical protein
MTQTSDDAYYVFVLRHPVTDERHAVVAKMLLLSREQLEEKWVHERFELPEIYRLRDQAWEVWGPADKASRESHPRTSNLVQLEKSAKQLEAYARELDIHVLNLEGHGLLTKPPD